MQRDWMKSTATYTFTEKDHKNGVKHNFSYVAKDVSAEMITKFGGIIDSLTEGNLLDATVATTDHVSVDAPVKEEASVEAPKA